MSIVGGITPWWLAPQREADADFPYDSDTGVDPPIPSLSLSSTCQTLGEADFPASTFIHHTSVPYPVIPQPLVMKHTEDLGLFATPGPAYLASDLGALSPATWEHHTEQALFNSSVVQSSLPDSLAFMSEPFSPGQYFAYSTRNSYTRTFRGRKSKAAYEVSNEIRPYACDICQAAFARSHDRDRHKRSHTGETPYLCYGCGTGFKRPDARKRHWERDPTCAQEDWLRVRYTPEGAKRRARAKTKPFKKQPEILEQSQQLP